MRNIKNLILSFTLSAMMAGGLCGSLNISATSKDDVVAAARNAGLPETLVQQGINYLQSGTFTSEQYDSMIAIIGSFAGMKEEEIINHLNNSGIQVEVPKQPTETEQPVQTEPQPPVENVVPDSSQPAESQPLEQSPAENAPVLETEKKDFASLTDEEKKEYIAGLTPAEQNQIIKDLDRETQLEIINKLIDASSELGMNVTVDSLTNDTLKYSVVNNNGEIVDISSVGVIVDDTGIDYTMLVVGALSVILISVSGIATFALWQRKHID